MTDTTKFDSLIPGYMALTFTQGHWLDKKILRNYSYVKWVEIAKTFAMVDSEGETIKKVW